MIKKIPYNFKTQDTVEFEDVYSAIILTQTINDEAEKFIGRFVNFGIFHVIEGEGSLQLDFDHYQIKKNDLIIAGPGQVIQDINIPNGKVGIINIQNHVIMDVWRRLDGVYVLNPDHTNSHISLNEEESDTLRIITEKLISKANEDFHFKSVLFNCLVVEALITIEEAMRRNPLPADQLKTITAKFFSLFYLNNSHERKVAFYADQLNITPNYLNIAVKKATGQNVKHFINEMILTDAKRLLKFTTMDAKQIAFELDFDSPAYFNYFFKKETGITPLDYRKQNK